MIYAQILAGGKGTRMGNVPMPKQFLSLADKPILIHTIEKFVLESRFDAILVVCPADWLSHTQDLVSKYVSDERVHVVTGGSERNETLMKGIEYIRDNYGLHDDDVVITHDAVRPFITSRIINDNIEAVLANPAVDTVVPAIDTIVQGSEEKIDDIPVRSTMYQGQTPQSFNIKTLIESYEALSDAQKETLSDSCKICLLAGQPVKMVRGENFNFKITTPYDLRVATALVETRS
ncbi:2-C-methyl-D-erythritol 4-phosphate cytidylyltransferase [Lactiplantibacillus fabifermentans]|uniref:Ribitol-5-phosphate cytidylyltransferase n=2 Tax=Lactiplantibacillus fabifermentans TaxID=483011 RepID=A0A0R2NRF9_9LACO|nr:2-C-methyl-D-erythritol 4-phosphate cytidylyltransferase [Lactiplantibacillus fabifermentans]ETY74374.1 2-C-methyl-D-erythritol 4-phosphate cytidylyltransferase [Lactiplantibacillus fabifermentans T30PCM01]KRO28262.1 2-C-methyl-D-erythritol 4-phosphate cytidylyltransferase [Lactiplantibacillus fabifermentans DSM 21115]